MRLSRNRDVANDDSDDVENYDDDDNTAKNSIVLSLTSAGIN